MEIFFYIIGGLCACASLIAGIILRFFPPKYGNEIYGFSTEISRESPETWKYAHRLCGNIMLIYAAVSIPIFAVLLVVFHNFFFGYAYLVLIIGFVIAIGCAVMSAIITQKKTKNYSITLDTKKTKKQ